LLRKQRKTLGGYFILPHLVALHGKPTAGLQTTERHLPDGITQCYLPHDTGQPTLP